MEKLIFNPISGKFDSIDIQTEFYVDLASFPLAGKANILYVDKTTKKQYLWNGLIYEAVSAELTLQQVTDNGHIVEYALPNSGIKEFVKYKKLGEDTTISVGLTDDNFFNLEFISNGNRVVIISNESSGVVKSSIGSFNILELNDVLLGQYRVNVIGNFTDFRTQTVQDANGTIALLSDIPSTESIQDAIGSIVDTSLVYTDATPLLSRAALIGDITAAEGSNTTAIANSVVTNAKLAQMPSNTVKVNNTASVANPIDLNLPINTVLGNETGLVAPIPLYEVISGTGTLIAGQHTVIDTRITTTSFVPSIAVSTTGSITSIPIKWTAGNGSMLFNTGQPSDTAMFGYTIYI